MNGVEGQAGGATPARPVVVVGFDAMDANLARSLMADGRMPNLAGFLDTAAWAPTQNPPGLLVGGLWPTITTGSWPDHHGFYCDLQIEPGTYEAWRHTPRDVSIPAVWDVLADAGRRSVLLDVPVCAPSSHENVVHLVEWGSHDRFLPLCSSPAALADEVTREYGQYPVQPKCDAYTRAGDPIGLFEALCAGADARERMAGAYLDREPCDLFWFVFSESHCAGHQLFALHDPGHPAHDPQLRAEIGDAMVQVYEHLDRAFGRFLARVGDDATVMVLMSHGMGNHHDGDHLLSEILLRLDVADDGRRRLVTLRERVIRRVRRKDQAQRRVRRLVGERRFFKVPNNELYAGIRINVKGREPRGRVAPGAEFDAVVAQLRDDLLALENPDTGAPVVLDVWRADEHYDGPLVDELPDLFVVWNRDGAITGVRSPKIGTIRGEPTTNRTGDHRPAGLFAVRAPDAEPGPLPTTVRAIDVAPTIAAHLGVAMPFAQGAPVAGLGEQRVGA